MNGRSCGEDVINENEVFFLELFCRGADLKSSVEVFEALFSGESRLPFGRTNTFESLEMRNGELFCKRARELKRLIEPSAAESASMERDRNEQRRNQLSESVFVTKPLCTK